MIPARMASSRFPGKPLEPLLGLALVLHVYERCKQCPDLDRVIIATCDEEIRIACEEHGAEVVMTADSHPGCVDRTDEAISIAASDMDDTDLVLMVQGDEILVDPEMLSNIVNAYSKTGAPVVNLASRIFDQTNHNDPDVVKVVGAPDGKALYFSRAPIPSHHRVDDMATVPVYQQTGIIGFSKQFVHQFGKMAQTPLEIVERIDMMRVIENGLPVQLVYSEKETIGVDTPADKARAEQILRSDPVTKTHMKDMV